MRMQPVAPPCDTTSLPVAALSAAALKLLSPGIAAATSIVVAAAPESRAIATPYSADHPPGRRSVALALRI
jgi:hypothetical protein